jgi:hypothetical protein
MASVCRLSRRGSSSASIALLKHSFQIARSIEPFYSGGKVSKAKDGTLATTLGETVLITRAHSDSIRIPGVQTLIAPLTIGY